MKLVNCESRFFCEDSFFNLLNRYFQNYFTKDPLTKPTFSVKFNATLFRQPNLQRSCFTRFTEWSISLTFYWIYCFTFLNRIYYFTEVKVKSWVSGCLGNLTIRSNISNESGALSRRTLTSSLPWAKVITSACSNTSLGNILEGKKLQ